MVERTEAAIENTERDIRELTEKRDQFNREIQSLDKALHATGGIESETQRLHDFQSMIRQLREDIAKLEEERKGLLASAWADLVDPVVSRKIEELRNEQEAHIKNVEKMGELRSKLKQIEQLLSNKVCPICGQPYPLTTVQSAERDRAEIELELEGLQFDQDRLAYLGDAIRKLSKVKPNGVAVTLKRVEDEIRRANVNLVGLENKRDNIQKRLEGHDLAAVVENRRRYNQLLKRLGTIESDIKVKESQLQRLKAEAADYRNKISQASGPQLDRLNCEVSMYESLLAIFEGAIVRLRDQLKIDVERDATEVFLQLTTDPTYERLRINERYGLSIIREGDREVPLRSTGAEQIVALSLISALNQNAVRRGPVIMDTPFGRLDPIHRANVLKFITRMANQVILLVHSGEIDKESDVALISQYIDEEYEITRISGSRSAINRTAFAAGER